METRQITQTKIWFLVLNPMQGHTEGRQVVAASDDRQKLIDWYEEQKAPEPWTDTGPNSFPAIGDFGGYQNDAHKWYKTFKQGSLLEWYNPLTTMLYEPNHYGHGIHAEWVTDGDLNNNIFLVP